MVAWLLTAYLSSRESTWCKLLGNPPEKRGVVVLLPSVSRSSVCSTIIVLSTKEKKVGKRNPPALPTGLLVLSIVCWPASRREKKFYIYNCIVDRRQTICRYDLKKIYMEETHTQESYGWQHPTPRLLTAIHAWVYYSFYIQASHISMVRTNVVIDIDWLISK